MKQTYLNQKAEDKMSDLDQLEHDFYELKPHLLALSGGISVYYNGGSKILLASGALFLISATSVFYMRYFARNH